MREGRVGRRPDRSDRGYGRGGGRNAGRWEDRAHIKGGATNLARIAGRTRLAREAGGISLVRIARKGTQASLPAAAAKEK